MNTVFIPVSDLKESVDWYERVLGFEIDPLQYHQIAKLPVYTFQMGETSLTLEEDRGFIPSSTKVPICNFHTTEIEKAKRELEENRVRIVSEIVTFPDFSYFNFNDINGNLLMICTG